MPLRYFVNPAAAALLLASCLPSAAQDRRGRKYKEPPPTSHIEVFVTRAGSDKPISNAAVIFRATRDGKDDGNLEVKTDPDGKAVIEVITTGSEVQVQVIAKGYATFADTYKVDEPTRDIHVSMERPREQVSAYVDNTGKASTRKAGVQEPEKQRTPPTPATGLQPRTPPSRPTGSDSSGDTTAAPTQ